jgi:aspartate aminotransferase
MPGSIATKIENFMKAGSWIRRMFEEGDQLKKEFGEENVCDLTLGNPMGEPPEEFQRALRDALEEPTPGKHGYMPNAGYPSIRSKLAAYLAEEHGVPLEGKHVIFTVGAAGALNVALKSLVNPGETVLIFSPFFVEYRFCIDNVGGQCKIVETDEEFNLDLNAIRNAFDPTVKALILNTPNNPTGRMYPEATLTQLASLVGEKSRECGHPIYILSDEPYKRIVYDGLVTPSVLKMSSTSILCTSFSKELAIAGERLGYVAVNPHCPGIDEVMHALIFCNRILGFVNAPALMQRALGRAIGSVVDIGHYAENRALLLSSLREMGYEVVTPEGAFYLFPKCPVDDDVAFVQELKKERILVVPGRGFGRAGYMRIAYCVTKEVIEKALPGFKRTIDRVKEGQA